MTLGKSSLNSRSSPIIIGLGGATDQMGQVIIQRITKVSICQLSSTFSRENNIREKDEFCRNSEIIIDFSNKDILETLLESALKYKNKLVIGTTGLSDKQIDIIRYISKDLPILYSSNMSLGANLLALLAEKASQILDKNYDIEILDYHHRFKNDAPSGTAIMLAEILAKIET